ncbi:undecaprenyl-phosphate alpha-N-acetylglucosaminyl 1-phosphate transferase [Pseudoalteromonas phenolica]|uniref:Undecaprenyl-phosphate alpha-N-acetylglucosaminyl 1-phosphate transferase n=1 Tax=Pseudoalteromonas phenolica TaxID=161398 RepID=A0A5R9PWL9_9GAMM|nr:UDP-N-acetylglucosamine--undecaprenyl-phosphate N-acetylglucosaminephosphotransferase [Pseudoalteromonas phenolica]TLX45308.1 undecaprenyl-phosphate alpha-N-acetylglucosaminyl 1-phosphate transferase [Pseudoalteromonas phenolica]
MYLEPIIFCFSLCAFINFIVHPIAVKVGLVDIPNQRKKHAGAIPLIGGLAIFISIAITSILFFSSNTQIFVYLFSAMTLLILGVLDDKNDLSVTIRLITQCGVSIFIFLAADMYLTTFGNILGFEVTLGKFGVLITVLSVIAAINAFNMVDGIDGLAGMLSLNTFLFISVTFLLAGSEWLFLSSIFIAAIIAFLMFNLRWPSKKLGKVFMGDAGSMVIGFTVIWLLLVGVDENVSAFRPVLALYLIAIPLMDMVAIMIRRIKKGTSPFKPDREHLHHIFERAGQSRRRALVTISIVAFIIAAIGLCMELLGVDEWKMFLVFCLLFMVYNYCLIHVWKILSWIRKH